MSSDIPILGGTTTTNAFDNEEVVVGTATNLHEKAGRSVVRT
jgi:hypothetical protein